MFATLDSSSSNAQSELSNDDLETLRYLLLGPEYKELLQHKQTLESPELLAEHISPVITQALQLRSASDDSVQTFFTPLLEKSLAESIARDPKPIADSLYPVIGPAIRKSINVSLTQMTNNINELLENSLTPKSFRWRFDAWRTGKSFAEIALNHQLVYQVEQIFLIHRKTGLLLQHVVADTAISKDPDVISGMLTAIQDFLRDSFETEAVSDLDTLKLGDLTVLIEHSPSAVMAAVIRGSVPSSLRDMFSETVEKVHSQEHDRFNDYNGDTTQFDHLQDTFVQCLKKQTRNKEAPLNETKTMPPKKKAMFALLGLSALLAIGYFTYADYAENKQWGELQQAFRSEPGIILSHASYEDGTYHLHGLVDSMANKPASIIEEYTEGGLSVESNFTPYLSLEPVFVLQRIEKALQPPSTVQLTLSDGELSANGSASANWVEQLKLSVPLFAGINTVNLNEMIIAE